MVSGPKAPSAYMAFIEKYRAWIVFFTVLPASCVLGAFEKLRRWITAPDASGHDARVQRVCADVRQWASLAPPRKPICTDRSSASSHSVRLTDKSRWHKIAMGDLRAILGVEQQADGRATVRVEPGVTVADVTNYLLHRGLQLECTLEMEEATLGGEED